MVFFDSFLYFLLIFHKIHKIKIKPKEFFSFFLYIYIFFFIFMKLKLKFIFCYKNVQHYIIYNIFFTHIKILMIAIKRFFRVFFSSLHLYLSFSLLLWSKSFLYVQRCNLELFQPEKCSPYYKKKKKLKSYEINKYIK